MGKIEIDHSGAGAGITLSSDGTDLLLGGAAVGGGATNYTIDTKTAAYTVVAGDLNKIINCTTGTFTISLTSAATLGSGFTVTIWNTGSGTVTIDPSNTETLDNQTTLKLYGSEGMEIVSDGTNWQTGNQKALRGYAEGFSSGILRPQVSSISAFAVGNNARALGSNSIALGTNALTGVTQSMALGYNATASSSGSLAIGTSAFAGNTRATAIGADSVGFGATAVGAGSVSLGGSYASGTDSFAAAIANNTSSYGATGSNSVAIGDLSKATNTNAVCLSNTSTASGTNSAVLGGSSGTASGSSATVIGGSSNVASGVNSTAKGYYGNTNGIRLKHATGVYPNMQGAYYVLAYATTDATPIALNTDAWTPSATNQIILPNNSAYAFHGTIVARQQASTGTASAAWKIEGLIRREGTAGTTVLVNSATTVLDNTPAWGMALTADVTNGGLAITVTGAAATNIRWVSTIHTSEVTY